MSVCRVMCYGAAWLLLLGWMLGTDSEMISSTAERNMTVSIQQASRSLETSDCKICISEEKCYEDYQLTQEEILLFNFTFSCIDPEHHFVIEVQKEIREDSDLEHALRLPQLPNLNRTYIWNIGVPYKVGVHLSFVGNYLEQIDSATCLDSVTYTIKGHLRYKSTSDVLVGIFCRNGTISNLKVQGKTLVELQVPWTETLDDAGFQLFFVSAIKKFSVVEVVLQPGAPVYFMSANWPMGFPNDELMTWKFSVPSRYHANVTKENYTLPTCVKREAGMYYGPSMLGKKASKFYKNFMLTLQNCDMDRTSTEVLTLRFKIELFHDYGERLEIKLKKEDGVYVKLKQILKIDGDPSTLFCICKFPVSSDCSSELELEPGDHLNISFHFACNKTRDIIVEATKNVSCKDSEECSVRNMGLSLPDILTTLPVPHQTFKWIVEQPPELTIELSSERFKLRQLLPGQTCDGNLMYNMSTFCQNGARSVVGQFCPNGTIDKIQTADHVLLELKTTDAWNSNDLDISLSFIPHLTEDYIMNILPNIGSPVYLLTPNWGPGMPNKLTASWNISIHADHVAELTFMNASVPKCEHGHVVIGIREQEEESSLMSFRETDSLPQSPVTLAHRFWLNVSNCELSSGHLNLMFQVLVLEDKDTTITIAVAVAGGVALLVIIAVIVCCVKKWKRRRQPALGIYNPGVNNHMPGRRQKFGKRRQDNDSHIYAVIDEDRVYADYFNKSRMLSIPEVDVYRSFEGPMGNVPPTLPPPRSATSKSASPEAVPMVSNDLYTFSVKKQDVEKSNGEMVTFLGNGEKDSSS
ncbi:CUB domain-containing protein 1-like [Heterodontus francisci]|uniref:CUB domain-containing protein 1-like n=1 Tax=Heterodontus francisci TaxID=7792 RepID=UPI00355BBF43